MAFTIIGNSIAGYLNTSTPVFCYRGMSLGGMMDRLAGMHPSKTLVISEICDIMEKKGSSRVSGSKVRYFEVELRWANNMPEVILCPFYPPQNVVDHQWGIINRLNILICKLNAARGYGTPALDVNLFERGKNGSLFSNRHHPRDNIYPAAELVEAMTTTIKSCIHNNKYSGDLRGLLVREDGIRKR